MRTMFQNSTTAVLKPSAVFGASILLLAGAMIGSAQAPMAPMAPAGQSASTNSADQNKQLADQVTELRAQVARLEAAVQQTSPGSKMVPKPAMKMSPAEARGMGMGEMGMAPTAGMAMKDDQGESEMGGQSKTAAPAAAMGMCCMGAMGAGRSPMPPAGPMAGMSASSSAMPGQAGASHLYHIGSNGFFLNHSQHITLTADQKLTLNRIKEKAMLDQASEQRRIDQNEQELYSLTAVDQPDNSRVQAKIGEIEKLRAEQRMNFIRSVEDASKVLSPDQRTALLGTMAKK